MLAGDFRKADAEDGPDEKPGDVAKAAAEKRKRFEQNGEGRGERHRRQGNDQERCEQSNSVEVRVLGSEELHNNGRESEHENHRGKDREIAEEFAKRVGTFCERGGRENLADAGLTIAVDGALDDVEADE